MSRRQMSKSSQRTPMRVVTVLGLLALAAGVALGVEAPFHTDLEQPAAGVTAIVTGAITLGVMRFLARPLVDHWSLILRRKQQAQGTVSGRGTARQQSDYTSVYQRVLKVSYPVGRRLHEVEWSPNPFYSNVGFLMQRVDRKYPNGTELVVYYEPGRPENAGVGRPWRAWLVTPALLAVLLACVSGTGFLVASTFAAAPKVTTDASDGDTP